MALKAFIIAQCQGFAAHGTNEDFEQVGRDWHGAIVTVVSGQLTVGTMSTQQLTLSLSEICRLQTDG